MPRSMSRELHDLAPVSPVLAAAIGWQTSSDAEPSKKASGQSAGAATRIEVVRPERRTVQRTVGEPGELEACETTPIYAKIAGYVHKVTVDIGSEIKKGQVLAELWV